jgi:CRP-like cAMP-binding protein
MNLSNSPDSNHIWMDGSDVSLNELSFKYGIPKEEAASFQAMVRVYPQGSVIIREGDQDKTLFLLRSGTVGIYRNMTDDLRMIATVEAINFVGEMSLILDEPRSATVIVESEFVVIYAIARPNLHLIMGNPKWAEILISRLSKDLRQANSERILSNNRANALEEENYRMLEEVKRREQDLEQQRGQMRQLLNGVLVLQRAVRNLAVVGSKGWHYINLLCGAVCCLAEQYVPGLELSEDGADPRVVQASLAAVQKAGPNDNMRGIVEEMAQEVRKQR